MFSIYTVDVVSLRSTCLSFYWRLDDLETSNLWDLEEQVQEACYKADERKERKDANDDNGYFVIVNVSLDLIVLLKSEIDLK